MRRGGFTERIQGGARAPQGLSLFGGRVQPCFQFRDFRLQALQPRTRAGQYHHLAVEFFPTHQVQFAEATLQQGLELAFDFVAGQRGVTAEQARGVAAQGVEEVFGREHGKYSGKLLAGSVSRSVYSHFHDLGRTLFAQGVGR